MKKVVIDLIICVCVLVVVLGVFVAMDSYKMPNCEVVAIEGDTVVVENEAGHLWTWEDTDAESYAVGDVVELEVSINGTDEVFSDDEVINVVRQGSED